MMMQGVYATTECISYDSHDNTIVISCGNASLTDVYNAISANNSGIINKGAEKVWTLNANIKVENNTNFYINSTDTSWLKINSAFAGIVDKEPNHILSRGNMIIDSVKITSWDANKNDYARANGTIPRSYILANYFNIDAVSDYGCNSNTASTVNKIDGRNPELVLALGDYSYQPTATCWFNAIQPIDSITKINTGNHEDEDSEDCNAYKNHFGLANPYYPYNLSYQ